MADSGDPIDAGDPAHDVDVIAAMLRSERAEAGDLVELLGTKLEGALPGRLEIKRRGGIFTRRRTVEMIVIAFSDARYTITREKHGPVASRAKVVRGVQIASREIPMTEWTAEVARELGRLGASNADARSALAKWVLGG